MAHGPRRGDQVSRFGVLPTIGGYEVIDEQDGRPVLDAAETAESALAAAQRLNDAAVLGGRALAVEFQRLLPTAFAEAAGYLR